MQCSNKNSAKKTAYQKDLPVRSTALIELGKTLRHSIHTLLIHFWPMFSFHIFWNPQKIKGDLRGYNMKTLARNGSSRYVSNDTYVHYFQWSVGIKLFFTIWPSTTHYIRQRDTLILISSVIRQKGESQNGFFTENKARQIFRKTNISYPLIRPFALLPTICQTAQDMDQIGRLFM